MPMNPATPMNAADINAPAIYLHNSFPDTWPPEIEDASCAICKQQINGASYPMVTVLDLGEQPLANALLTSPDHQARRFPLRLVECQCCRHVQLAQTVRADLMFDAYTYRTGMSQTMRRHFINLACEIRKELGDGARVCEVGCNDGTLLRALRTSGMVAYGVDPSSVSRAEEDLEIIPRYFTRRMAEELRDERGSVDCVVMTNVLAHVPDPHELIRGAWTLLKDRGLLIIEFPYVRDLADNLAWDTCYHEHVHYLSLKDIMRLLIGKYWKVTVEHLPHIHGGSLRVTAVRTSLTYLPLWRNHDGQQELEGDETWRELYHREVHQPVNWKNFQRRVEDHRDQLREATANAYDLVGLYAPAKATVLLNYCGIYPTRVIDDTPEKQGRWIPGVNVPVVPRAELGRPDLALLLAWNFKDEVARREVDLRGRILCPLPTIEII